MSREKIVLSWSGGKDSAFALFTLLHNPDYEVVSLLSTITREYDRLSMHGVRRILIERQAKATNLPLIKVFIPSNCTDFIYASVMESEMKQLKLAGINTMAFGDIYLQDVRTYRENNMAKVGMKCLFPLWGIDSLNLVYSFIDAGLKSITTCIDSRVLDVKFLGRVIDRSFLADIPPGIDPAGEKGEFHSFAFAGPVFNRTIPFVVGESVLRDSFHFVDLLPENK
jgi:uncharacterized protein (TIGR00290 family)